MSTDPWASTQTSTPAAPASMDDRLGADSPAEREGRSIDDRLLGGERLPSLFNKRHDVGDGFTCVIRDIPFLKHDRTFVEGSTGELKYWENVPKADPKTGKPVKVVTSAIGNDGKPNQPIEVMVLPLDTDERMTDAQLEAKGMESDDGSRGWFMNKDGERQLGAAMRKNKLKSADLIGWTITVTRTGKVKSGDFASWTHSVVLSK